MSTFMQQSQCYNRVMKDYKLMYYYCQEQARVISLDPAIPGIPNFDKCSVMSLKEVSNLL